MPPRIIRQQMSFTPRQLEALERLAKRLERPKTELVREAVERLLADPPRPVALPSTRKATAAVRMQQ